MTRPSGPWDEIKYQPTIYKLQAWVAQKIGVSDSYITNFIAGKFSPSAWSKQWQAFEELTGHDVKWWAAVDPGKDRRRALHYLTKDQFRKETNK